MLDDHGVRPFIAKAGSCLHEIEISIIPIVPQEVALHLQVHLLKLYVDVFDLLEQGLVLEELHLLAPQLVLLHLRQVQSLYSLADLAVDLFVG